MRENLSSLKGARKTMPSARNSVSKPGLSQIGKIDQLIPNAEIRTPVHLIPNEPNLRVFVVNTLPNSTLDNTSGLNFESTEQISSDVVVGNQKQTEIENSSKQIHEMYSNRFTPVSTINNYGKRSTEKVHTSDSHIRKKALKVIQEIRKYPRKTYSNSAKTSRNFPMPEAKKLENIQLKHLKEKFSRTFLSTSQNGVYPNQESDETSDGLQSFQVPQNSKEMDKKHQVRHVRFSEKESQHAVRMRTAPVVNGANFTFHKVPGHKFRGRPLPRILVRHNVKGSSSREPASQNVPVAPVKKAESIPRLNMGENSTGLDDFMGRAPGVAPLCYRMPKVPRFSDPRLFLHRNFPVHSSSRRLMGTATRGPCQNAEGPKLVHPSRFYSLKNPLLQFVSASAPTGPGHSGFCGSANIRDGHGKPSTICSQTLATGSRLDVGGSKRNNTNDARKRSLKEENTRAGNDCEAFHPASSNEGPNKGEDKVSNTRRMLDNISKLLNDIDEELSDEFECNGLELALPIWKKELKQCILSVEKIKNALLDHQERK